MQVTQPSSFFASSSSICGSRTGAGPSSGCRAAASLDMLLRAMPTTQNLSGSRAGGEIVERRNHQPMGEVAGDAEDDKEQGRLRGLLLTVRHSRLALSNRSASSASRWPPKPTRIADSILSAKVCSWRERKRAKSAAVRTSAGTASRSPH